MVKQQRIYEPVRLRQKKLANGVISLYLDIYYKGKRSFEFLRLYLNPPIDRVIQIQNQNILKIANEIKQRRTIEVLGRAYGLGWDERPSETGKTLFESIAEREQDVTLRPNSARFYKSLGKYIKEYYREDILLNEITPDFIRGFMRWLKTRGMLEGTQYNYVSKLRAVLSEQEREGNLRTNPFNQIPKNEIPKKNFRQRQYLTEAEIKAFASVDYSDFTPKQREALKAFLFACFTGLRWSDIIALEWDNIKRSESGLQLEFEQVKTGGAVILPLSSTALLLIGGVQKKEGRVFPLLAQHGVNANLIIKRVAKLAGIKKDITFHCGRHTFATLAITRGVDIFTTSKLMGHKDVKETQIYAKLVDSKRRAAVELLPKLEL